MSHSIATVLKDSTTDIFKLWYRYNEESWPSLKFLTLRCGPVTHLRPRVRRNCLVLEQFTWRMPNSGHLQADVIDDNDRNI